MDEIQASVLRVKLRYLDTWIRQRREHALTYDRLLANARIGLPCTHPDSTHVWYVYVVRSSQRDELRRNLTEREIGSGIHFPVPVHLQPATAYLGYGVGSLPHTEKAASEVLSLPMYAELTDNQLRWVRDAICEANVELLSSA